MTVHLRRGEKADAAEVGDICYRAFAAIAAAHGFRPDFPSAALAAGLLAGFLGHERFYVVVAEAGARIIGSNFLDERNPVAGIGPITVDPADQNEGTGRALMHAVIQRAHERRFPAIRLVQAGYHSRSLALYLKLGFEVREHLSCLQGRAVGGAQGGCSVRPALASDLAACNRLCARIHGHDRGGELADAVAEGTARVVERDGHLAGYATAIAFFGHAVCETNDDLKALIREPPSYPGAGFLMPTRNSELMQWCLEHGLRIVHTMTLMTIGLYNEPGGAWLPSVTY